MNHYILDKDNRQKKVPFHEWAVWFENGGGVVKQEDVGPVMVSTVFCGLGTAYWETMTFGGGNKLEYQRRCTGSVEQAEAMHQGAVDYIQEKLKEMREEER